jgi:8-oxo-dGTP pyrophosphatase MutT (NUDIX family)
MAEWKTKLIQKVYENRNFQIRKNVCFHPGKDVEHDFFIIDTYNWMNAVAITDDNKFVLVKQHRLGSNEVMIETPGGVIDLDEKAADCAARELAEETGYCGGEIILLRKLWSNPAIMSNKISYYLIQGCSKGQCQNLDPAEDIEVITAEADEVVEMLKTGAINHALSVTALTLYFLSEHNRFGRIFI